MWRPRQDGNLTIAENAKGHPGKGGPSRESARWRSDDFNVRDAWRNPVGENHASMTIIALAPSGVNPGRLGVRMDSSDSAGLHLGNGRGVAA